MKSPLLVLAACFAAGIVASREASFSLESGGFLVAFAGLCLLAGLWAVATRRRWAAILAAIAGFSLAGAAAAALFPYRFAPSNLKYAARDNAAAEVEGMISSTPRRICGREQFTLDVHRISWGGRASRATGYLKVDVEAPSTSKGWSALDHLSLQYGVCIRAPIRLYRPAVYRNPGDFNYRSWLDSIEDTDWDGIVSKPEDIRKLANCNPPVAVAAVRGARQKLLNAIDAIYPPWTRKGRDGAVLKAILVGDRSALDSETILNFQSSGLYHLLVIAGLHVALLAALVTLLLRLLRLPEAWRAALVVLFLIGYAVLVEQRAATMRATLMILSYLIARYLYRERSALNAVGLAGLILLVARPAWLFDAGFEFSFGAALLIVCLTVPLLERTIEPYRRAAPQLSSLDRDFRLAPRQTQFRLDLRRIVRAFESKLSFLRQRAAIAERAVCFAVEALLACAGYVFFCLVLQVGLLLPMAAIFNRVILVGVGLNVLALPVMTVLLSLAVPTVLLAVIHPSLALWPAKLLGLVMDALFWLTQNSSRPHWLSFRIPGPPTWVGWGFVLAFVAAALALGRSRRMFASSCAAAGIFAALIVAYPFAPRLSSGWLQMTELDCGRGESLLIVLPDRKTILVDAGGSPSRAGEDRACPGRWDPGESIVSPYLWSRRIRTIDTLVLTSGSGGALEGMGAIARNFHVRQFWYPPSAHHNPDAVELLQKFDQRGIRSKAMTEGNFAGDARVLWPPGASSGDDTDATDGDLSLSVQTNGESVLILDGMSEAAQTAATESHAGDRPEVLETAYLADASTAIRQMKPQIVVVGARSPGKESSAGKRRFRVDGAVVFKPYDDGAVTIGWVGSQLLVQCYARKDCGAELDGANWHAPRRRAQGSKSEAPDPRAVVNGPIISGSERRLGARMDHGNGRGNPRRADKGAAAAGRDGSGDQHAPAVRNAD